MMHPLVLWIVHAADWIFGWILYLPRDLKLLSVAVLTSASLTLARKWTTDQEWLHRAATDEIGQNQLRREARKRGDKEAAKRHQDIIARIKMKSLRFEGKPLLWALIPVALLATWAFARLAYLPPRANQPIEVRACVPRAAIGQRAHLAPEPGIEVAGNWIQPVIEDRRAVSSNTWDTVGRWIGDRARGLCHGKNAALAAAPPPTGGAAVWRVILHDTQPHVLKIRYAGRTYEAPLCAGTRYYEEPVTVFPDAPLQSIEVALKPLRLFDFVGSIDWLLLPPWLVAYLLIAIPFVTILRRILRVA